MIATAAPRPPAVSAAPEPKFDLTCSRQFTAWLAEQRVSLAFTTYQAGKLFLLGLQPDGRLSVFERTFNRCLGLWADGQTLWMSSLYQLWRFENVLELGQTPNGYDRLYVPQVAYTTGDLDIHDVAVDATGRVVFVNTLFGCLATVSERWSFVPLWKPRFISKLAAEDRCHLNGLAMETEEVESRGSDGVESRGLRVQSQKGRSDEKVDSPLSKEGHTGERGRPRYVTAVSQSDVADGWRERRRDGGCVIDVQSDQVIVTGLSMPHSPRLYRGELWLLDSGSGYFGRVDLERGAFEPIAFCPGYLRGLTFVGNYAVVGLSLQRENRTFQGLALDGNLAARQAEPRCGLCVLDLASGDIVHWVRIEGVVRELYDVVVLPGVRRPTALGFKTDEIRRTLSVGEMGTL